MRRGRCEAESGRVSTVRQPAATASDGSLAVRVAPVRPHGVSLPIEAQGAAMTPASAGDQPAAAHCAAGLVRVFDAPRLSSYDRLYWCRPVCVAHFAEADMHAKRASKSV